MWIPVSGFYRPERGFEPCKCLSEKSGQTPYGLGKRDTGGEISLVLSFWAIGDFFMTRVFVYAMMLQKITGNETASFRFGDMTV